jgi:hypothetical protein
VEESGLVD